MGKEITTLVDDIYSVVDGMGGWDSVVSNHFKETIGDTMEARLNPSPHPSGTLRMSSIGQPCERKLWYSVNDPHAAEELRSSTRLKFLYGDVIEDLLLSLALAAGHTVEGHQDPMVIQGIKGHRDAVIDGVTVDVKSASSYSFKKFKYHNLEYDDPFGYLWQLGSYVHAGASDPLVTDKDGGAFLAIDKQHGHLCLDYYNFKTLGYLDDIEDFYEERKKSVAMPSPPHRGYPTEADGKSGNRKLGFQCSYCAWKHDCHPGLRTFLYSTGPRYLTKVVREPASTVKEIT